MSKFKVGDRVRHAGTQMTGTVIDDMDGYRVHVKWDDWETLWHGDIFLKHIDPQPEETRSTSDSGAEKGVKPETFSLIPVQALEQVARHYGVGAKKYAPHNWRAGYEWSKSYDALQRHANAFWRGEDTDQETGSPHMAAVAFHALTLLTFMQEQPEYDDRYKEQK